MGPPLGPPAGTNGRRAKLSVVKGYHPTSAGPCIPPAIAQQSLSGHRFAYETDTPNDDEGLAVGDMRQQWTSTS